jgi:hypothetical protein
VTDCLNIGKVGIEPYLPLCAPGSVADRGSFNPWIRNWNGSKIRIIFPIASLQVLGQKTLILGQISVEDKESGVIESSRSGINIPDPQHLFLKPEFQSLNEALRRLNSGTENSASGDGQ